MNDLVSSWIVNYVTKDVAINLLYHELVAATWMNLLERFQQRNDPMIFQLKKILSELKQGQLPIIIYYTK